MKKFWKRYGFIILAISPFFIQFLIFQLVPTVSTILLSLTDWNGMSEPKFIGMANYKMMLMDYQFREALLNYKGLRCRRFFKTAMFLPYVCATIAVGLVFGMLFDENAGLVNAILGLMGIQPVPWLTSSKFARIPVEILFVWRLIPWYVLIYLSGLLGIPRDYYEAATVDGANVVQQFFCITGT